MLLIVSRIMIIAWLTMLYAKFTDETL